jgi:hypothetical protein
LPARRRKRAVLKIYNPEITLFLKLHLLLKIVAKKRFSLLQIPTPYENDWIKW